MRSQVSFLLVLTIVCMGPAATLAQTPAKQSEDRIISQTTEVVFDALVKDKKGRPVKDLQAADFQILEDGVLQDVKSFRLVTGENAAAQPATSPDKTNKSGSRSAARVLEAFNAGRLGTVALVFDRLSADGRSRAHDAAIAYLGNGLGTNDYIGVFGIDQTLTVFQTYSNNEMQIKAAIDKAAVTTSTTPSVNRQQIDEMLKRDIALRNQAAQGEAAAGATQNTGNIGPTTIEMILNQMALRTAEGFERMEQTEQGRATTEGLLSIISGLSNIPGRKAMVFFSEGISIPTSVAANFTTVISNANRSNVSIYAVDAAGLRALSTDLRTGQSLTALGQQSVARAGSSEDSFGSMMRDSETAEKLVRNNPEGVLGQLANQTGGFLVSSTNNLGPRLRQVNDDLHSYYVLTYTPKNSEYDGKFRQISVKVKRSDVDVQARKGYYAVGAQYDTPVLSFEAPALALLNKAQTNAFETYGRAFSLPAIQQPGFVPIFVEVPAGTVNLTVDHEKKIYKSDFAIVAVVKDELGHPVKKVSGHYLLNGPLDQLETAKRTPILLYRETDLEAGNYNLDTIVLDSTSNKSSVTHSSLSVPEFDETKLHITDLIIVRKTQKAVADNQSNPLKVNELILFPNLGEALHKTGSRGLSMFLTIYLPRGSTAVPKMSIELDQGGKPLGQLPIQLPAADSNGRIQYTGTIPLDAFPPGEYELKAMVTDGISKGTRSQRFTVQP